MRKFFVLILLFLAQGVWNSLLAQKDSGKFIPLHPKGFAPPGQIAHKTDTAKATKRLPAVVEHGDTIPIFSLKETKVSPPIDADEVEKQQEWDRLLRNVRFLMQYANLCAYKMQEIDAKMDTMDKKHDRKKYLRKEREQLVKDYSDKLKALSVYQGNLLIKLIYRQTGKTTYDIIKEYESGFTAGFWQTISKLDAMNLKDTYDPNRDVMIATALKQCGY